MRSTLFCCELPRHDTGTYYAHFYRTLFSLRCYNKQVRALIAEVNSDPEGEYWAWWDSNTHTFRHVYLTEGLVEMCFAYGTKPEENRDRGRKLRVKVTILREAGPKDTDLRLFNGPAFQRPTSLVPDNVPQNEASARE
jgi:hypothetical protein